MKLLCLLLAVNGLFLVSVVYLALIEPELTRLNAAMSYTALDRAGVINQSKLAEFNPSLADNDRNNVPRWIARETLVAQKRNAWIVGYLAAMNLVIATALAFQLRRQRFHRT